MRSFPLLVAAALLVQSAQAVAHIPPGFLPEVLVTEVTPAGQRSPAEGAVFLERLRVALLSRSQVSSIGFSWHAPLSEKRLGVLLEAPSSAVADPTTVAGNIVSPGYFRTLGIGVLQGRAFGVRDDSNGPPVAIVNQAFAERWWPGRAAVGHEIFLPRSGSRYRVIGVVDNVRYRLLTESTQPLVYFPLAQRFQSWVFAFVRTNRGDPMEALPAVRTSAAELDPRTGIGNPRTLRQEVELALAEWRGPASLSVLLAVVTLLLAVVGLYATLSYSVLRKRREIAIRRAVGAQNRQVRRLIVRQGMGLVVPGIVLGVGSATVLAAFLDSLVYAVEPRDASTYAAAAGLLGLTTWLSCFRAARQAVEVDPIIALKRE